MSTACFAFASELRGQSPDPPLESDDGAAFGLWLGGELVPAGVEPACGSSGVQTMGMLGALIVVPVGPFALQGRMGGHGGSETCVFGGPLLLGLGTHTFRVSEVSAGSFATLDLRVRWVPSDNLPWVVALGAGWAASSKDIPYLSTSVGLRGAQAISVGVDLELSVYRVPWTERTWEVTDSSTVVTSRRAFEEWSPAVGIRFTLEMPVSPADAPDGP